LRIPTTGEADPAIVPQAAPNQAADAIRESADTNYKSAGACDAQASDTG
jgi:hypothetical protein